MIRLVYLVAGIVIGVIFDEPLTKVWNTIYTVLVLLINWLKTIMEVA